MKGYWPCLLCLIGAVTGFGDLTVTNLCNEEVYLAGGITTFVFGDSRLV